MGKFNGNLFNESERELKDLSALGRSSNVEKPYNIEKTLDITSVNKKDKNSLDTNSEVYEPYKDRKITLHHVQELQFTNLNERFWLKRYLSASMLYFTI